MRPVRPSAGCGRGGGASSATPRNNSRTPKLLSALPKEHRRHVALAKRLAVERRAQPARHLDLLAQFRERRFAGSRRASSGSSSPLHLTGSTTWSRAPRSNSSSASANRS